MVALEEQPVRLDQPLCETEPLQEHVFPLPLLPSARSCGPSQCPDSYDGVIIFTLTLLRPLLGDPHTKLSCLRSSQGLLDYRTHLQSLRQ